MAFILLKRSRNTKGFYLIENHREGSRVRRRTLCYLGREQDGTDSLARALAHWKRIAGQAGIELSSANGKRREVIRRRLASAREKIALLKTHLALEAEAEARRRERERLAQESERWQALDPLRRHSGEENARAAKRALFTLAEVYHPDHGGTHDGFLRLKDAYDRATAAWRRMAG